MTDKQVKLYVGSRLKEMREAAGLRQEDVGKVVGLSRVSVLNIESGRHNPTIKTMILLCRLFKCRPNDIFPPIEALNFVMEEKTITVKKKKKVLKILK